MSFARLFPCYSCPDTFKYLCGRDSHLWFATPAIRKNLLHSDTGREKERVCEHTQFDGATQNWIVRYGRNRPFLSCSTVTSEGYVSVAFET